MSESFDRGVVGIGIVMRVRESPSSRPGPVVAQFAEAYRRLPTRSAEKLAVLRALEIAAESSAVRVRVRSDYNHMSRRLKEDHAAGVEASSTSLHGAILGLARSFEEVKFSDVPRRKNQEAHGLARRAAAEAPVQVRVGLEWD